MQSRKGLYQNGDLCAQAKMVSLTSWVREQLLPLGIPLAMVVPGWSLRKWDIWAKIQMSRSSRYVKGEGISRQRHQCGQRASGWKEGGGCVPELNEHQRGGSVVDEEREGREMGCERRPRAGPAQAMKAVEAHGILIWKQWEVSREFPGESNTTYSCGLRH